MYEAFETELDALKRILDAENEYVDYNPEILKAFLEKTFKRKQTLAQVLGLGPDHRRVVQVSGMPNRDDLENATLDDLNRIASAVYGLPESVEEFNVIGNTLRLSGEKRDHKLSRYLARAFKGAAEHKELLEVVIPRFYDAIGRMNRNFVISANPLDYLIAADEPHCGFSSCYGMDGEHANGTLSYALDSFTVMLFDIGSSKSASDDDEAAYPYEKKGRAWAYIHPDLNRFIIAKGYGTMDRPSALGPLSDRISTALAAHAGVENKWAAKLGFNFPEETDSEIENAGGHHNYEDHENYPVYFDVDVSRYVVLKSFMQDLGADAVSKVKYSIEFVDAECLKCGRATKNSDGFACKDCVGGKCENCGDREEELETVYTRGDDSRSEEWCSDCAYDSATECHRCENRYSDGSVLLTPAGDYHYCDDCTWRHLAKCYSCEEHFPDHDVSISEVDHESRCRNCHDEHMAEYTCCKRCDTYTDVPEEVRVGGDRENWCPDCVTSHAYACDECDEAFCGSHAVRHEGSVYCSASCAPENEEAESPVAAAA